MLSPEEATTLVLACCGLHNFIIAENDPGNLYISPGLVDEEDSDTGALIPGTTLFYLFRIASFCVGI